MTMQKTLISYDKDLLKNSYVPAKPFVKWLGGKRSIIEKITSRMPKTFTRYYECFVGGGAMFFEIQANPSRISDTNPYLITTYLAIRDDVDRVIKYLKIHKSKHCKTWYLKCRKSLNTESDCAKLAALVIYINKTCFNGLYRVNRANEFNVPMGSYQNPLILDESNLRQVSQVLANTDIAFHDFKETPIKKHAFYYLDPPYYRTFSNYAKDGFDKNDHKRLARFCDKLHNAGAKFLLSNSNTKFIQNLYKDYLIEKISALRSISCKASQRVHTSEVLIRNYR